MPASPVPAPATSRPAPTPACTSVGERRRQARFALGRLDRTLKGVVAEAEQIRAQIDALAISYSEDRAGAVVERVAETHAELAAAASSVAVEPQLLFATEARGSAARRIAQILNDLTFEQQRLSALMLGKEQPQRLSAPAPAGRPPTSGIKRRGRPSRRDTVSAEFVAAAPFPELALEPADRLPTFIRTIDDRDLLERALSFERQHDQRKTVIRVLETRLRLLFGVSVAR